MPESYKPPKPNDAVEICRNCKNIIKSWEGVRYCDLDESEEPIDEYGTCDEWQQAISKKE